MCTKFHWSLIKNNKVIEVWNFFYKSAFWLVGLDGKIMDLHQQNFSGQYWGVKLTCIPNFSKIGQFLQKLSHFIEFRLVGWLGWLGPSDFKKISRWKADGHNISAYKKSSWYLKAFKSYPIFKVRDDNNDNDDADIIGGWIIVRSVLTPSRTKIPIISSYRCLKLFGNGLTDFHCQISSVLLDTFGHCCFGC